MTQPDTSAAAVERLARLIAMHGDDQDTAALSALLARVERTEAARDTARFQRDKAVERADNAGTERDAARAERDEAIATLALYRAEHGCTRGQRTTQWCGEATRLRRAWLRAIQAENACPATGGGCLSQQCGCVVEMEMLMNEAERSHDR